MVKSGKAMGKKDLYLAATNEVDFFAGFVGIKPPGGKSVTESLQRLKPMIWRYFLANQC